MIRVPPSTTLDRSSAASDVYKRQLQYEVSSKTGGLIVFSEIYYPGWTATVDGQEVAVGRVNYVLRAINVKPGHHKVVLDFHPKLSLIHISEPTRPY